MSDYANIPRGKLQLKGVNISSKKKKKKKKKDKADDHEIADSAASGSKRKTEQIEILEFEVTEHQKKHQKVLETTVTNKIVASMTEKSYRERVDEYNRKLASLTEHHDIPRISAAGNG